MRPDALLELLESVARGDTRSADALEKLRTLPYEDLEFARVDHHRTLRQGWPEAIFCEGKAAEEILAISQAIYKSGSNLLATRLSPDKFDVIGKRIPGIRYNEKGRIAVAIQQEPEKGHPVAVLTAGTSDIPVAEEAIETLRSLGHDPDPIYDVGVAGIHRVIAQEERMRRARVILVLAGMEGALVSVVAGLTSVPVVGVPTSIGYGTALGGMTALFGMLNSCASGVTVVNIDNGFGAACAAHRILRSSQGGR